jgi:hypothetical protein
MGSIVPYRVGLQVGVPGMSMHHVDVRYSRDGGNNWSDWRTLEFGDTGDFVKRIELRRFGRGRQWVFDIRVTDNVRADLMAASTMAEGTDS